MVCTVNHYTAAAITTTTLAITAAIATTKRRVCFNCCQNVLLLQSTHYNAAILVAWVNYNAGGMNTVAD